MMKIVNIEIFRKAVTYDNIKSDKKNQGVTFSLEDIFLEKPQAPIPQIDPPPTPPPPSLLSVETCCHNKIK